MVAGTAKAYNLPFNYVLYQVSFANLTLYSAVLPSYDSRKDAKPEDNEIIKADDPANADKIKAMFDKYRD